MGRIARARLVSPDDVQAVEGYAPEQLRHGDTIYDTIKAAAKQHPEKSAIIQMWTHRVEDPVRVVTYRDLIEGIERSANLFNAVASAEASAVAVVLPMVPESLIATWGAATAGVAVPINPHLEHHAVISILNAAGATALVTTPGQFETSDGNGLADVMAAVPTLRCVLYVGGSDPAADFMTAIDEYPSSELAFTPAADPRSEAMYMPTGGTTGLSKMVRMTHWGQLTVAWNVGALMGSSPDGVVGHGMPNFHCGGTLSLGLRTIIYGQTLLTLTPEGFRNKGVVRNFWNIARHYKMTSVLATPTTAAAILEVSDTNSDGHCITEFHCGGSTLPLELVRAFHRRFGIWLRENWGMTEVHGTMTGHLATGEQPRVGSAGLPLPFIRVKSVVVDETNGFVRECVPGERGLLVIGGPTIMRGYSEPRLDNEFFIHGMPDGQPWASSGDIGIVDEDGYVWIFGRSKDLIIRGGHNIDPAPIEEALVEHPGVYVAAAVGRPDPLKGELPMAYVQLHDGSRANSGELIEFCRSRIRERASLPVEIVILDEIPMTPVGKISKPALRIDALKRVVESVAADVLGSSGNVEVTVDETGARPSAVLKLSTPTNVDQEVREKLDSALANYEFTTCIEWCRRRL